MASLDSLPADQRAVLQLVLLRDRSYDQIADMLSLDRAAVRDRALAAFDALGPKTDIEPQRRALITDYLLNQLPGRVSDQIRARLTDNAGERAWAAELAFALAEVASRPLPEVPQVDGRDARPSDRDRTQAPNDAAKTPEDPGQTPAREPAAPPTEPSPAAQPKRRRRRSRVGGMILLVLGAAVVVVVVILLTSGSGTKHHSSSTAAVLAPTTSASSATTAVKTSGTGSATSPTTTATSHSGTATGATTATTTSGTATKTSATNLPTHIVAQINLDPPSGGSAKGIADIVTQGSTTAVAIEAQGLAPNSTHPPNAYAVWLYNSPSDSYRLGFVNPGVTSNGRLQTAGALPAGAARFKQLIVTLETVGNPKSPGQIVLAGTLTGL